ncbi:MAG: glycosyltransferase family 2 protein [Candidatus Omnitrophica bacterium]|nr:glycosyltransferase family 2 protein [Candidatus Omnitrophota bacterium]MCM8793290.1 glycosyltransferase family 2 protein [Candidatus Omnitrophota bacterium]
MDKKTPLTVVILTKNEEERIKDCIESVKDWVEEIIVVDDESTDRTAEIAQNLGAKVLKRKMDIEGKQRNWAYQKARNLWVLSLDADERITKELRDEIIRLFAEGPRSNGYTIPRRNYIGNYWLRYGGEYPAPQLKLFRKDKFRFEEVGVHPRAFLEGKCGFLKNDLIHYSYRNFSDYLNKLNNQTTREAEKWILTGRRMTFWQALWRALDRFFYRRMLRKKAYRDGIYGFMTALFSGLYQLLSYAKYRELLSKHLEVSPPKILEK